MDDSVTLVEWGEGMVEQLADAHLEVRIDRRDDDVRDVVLAGHGGDWAQRLATFGVADYACRGNRFGDARDHRRGRQRSPTTSRSGCWPSG